MRSYLEVSNSHLNLSSACTTNINARSKDAINEAICICLRLVALALMKLRRENMAERQ